MQAIVLVGGMGTRLGEPIPKALVPLGGAAVLRHILAWLGQEAVRDVVLCVGHGSEAIRTAIGDGSDMGLRIRYSVETTPLGTAGAVRGARALLDERFMIVYGDVVADLDVSAMLQAHLDADVVATLAVHPNDHPFDSDRVVTNARNLITGLVRKEDRAGAVAGALCNAALYIVERKVIDAIPGDAEPRDFARDVFPAMIGRGESILAYRTTEYLKDMGTPSRRAQVEADLGNGVPRLLRRSGPRSAVLVDRDGVLNVDIPFIGAPGQVQLLPGVARALSRLNQARVLAVCCTNQPVVARGEVTEEGLHEIHRVLEGMIGEEHAWLDAIYVCPHHGDKGFAGERVDLKRSCSCRKPQPGLLLKAVADLGIDKRSSIFVGDRTTDLRAARAAGIVPLGVRTGKGCRDGAVDSEVAIVPSLSEAVAFLLDTVPSAESLLERARSSKIVLLGGPSGSGKTLAANALRIALQGGGVPVMHVSLDRFIQPRSRRRAGMTVTERVSFELSAQSMEEVIRGRSVVCPDYDAFTGDSAPSKIVQWNGSGVLLVDGLLANSLRLEGALRLAFDAEALTLVERRRVAAEWKSSPERIELTAAERNEEDHTVRRANEHAHLRITFDETQRLRVAP